MKLIVRLRMRKMNGEVMMVRLLVWCGMQMRSFRGHNVWLLEGRPTSREAEGGEVYGWKDVHSNEVEKDESKDYKLCPGKTSSPCSIGFLVLMHLHLLAGRRGVGVGAVFVLLWMLMLFECCLRPP